MARMLKWGLVLAFGLAIGLVGGFAGLVAGLELASLLLGLFLGAVGFTVGSYLAIVGAAALLGLGKPLGPRHS